MQMVNRVPVNNDKLIGQAVAWFVSKQAPDEVNFTRYDNGYKLQVFTDEDNADEAMSFWEENVQPHLGDE